MFHLAKKFYKTIELKICWLVTSSVVVVESILHNPSQVLEVSRRHQLCSLGISKNFAVDSVSQLMRVGQGKDDTEDYSKKYSKNKNNKF